MHRGFVLPLVAWASLALPPLCRPAGGDLLRIMPLGDSNTGVDPAQFPDVPADHPAFDNLSKYRGLLAELLAARGCLVDFVGTQHSGALPLDDWDHEGHGGYRTDQVVHGPGGDGVGGINDWLDRLAAADQLPDIVLVMLGTNDVLQGQVYRNQAAANLGELLDLLLARVPNAQVYLASIPPLLFTVPQWNRFATELNGQIRDLALARAAAGDNVRFVDANSYLGLDDIAGDGINLNRSGLDKLAVAWNDAIQPVSHLSPEPATLLFAAAGPLFLRPRKRRRQRGNSPDRLFAGARI